MALPLLTFKIDNQKLRFVFDLAVAWGPKVFLARRKIFPSRRSLLSPKNKSSRKKASLREESAVPQSDKSITDKAIANNPSIIIVTNLTRNKKKERKKLPPSAPIWCRDCAPQSQMTHSSEIANSAIFRI